MDNEQMKRWAVNGILSLSVIVALSLLGWGVTTLLKGASTPPAPAVAKPGPMATAAPSPAPELAPAEVAEPVEATPTPQVADASVRPDVPQDPNTQRRQQVQTRLGQGLQQNPQLQQRLQNLQQQLQDPAVQQQIRDQLQQLQNRRRGAAGGGNTGNNLPAGDPNLAPDGG